MASIEPAREDDLPQLVVLLHSLFEQEADFTPESRIQEAGLRLILNSPATGIIFVARNGGEVVGMVNLLFTVSTAEGCRVCWLEDLVVRADHRGAGLGTRLLGYAIADAQRRGLGRITLLTDRMNAAAIRLYTRLGFRESAMIPLRLQLRSGDAAAS